MFQNVNRQSGPRPAFTLVELLVVIAIIALLIGIAVPSISAARSAAKKVATLATIKGLGEGCEAFNGEFNRYPKSNDRGGNPFFAGNNATLSGAQWLTIQLSGPDFEGYVDWRDPKANARGTTQGIDHNDWQAWYGLDSTGEYRGLRVGPYVTADSSNTMTPERLLQEGTRAITLSESIADERDVPFLAKKLPYYQDRWNNPILYYAANVGSPLPFTPANGGGDPGGGGGEGGAFTVTDGVYDQSDNKQWTGGPGGVGINPNADEGTNLGGQFEHQIKEIGYSRGQQTRPNPDDPSFASFLYDRALFEQTLNGTKGKIRPYNPETFIMISAGEDRIFGTGDDVKNFNN
ncbi:MAG: type II secretion system protein [Phycisphaerae bacterium]